MDQEFERIHPFTMSKFVNSNKKPSKSYNIRLKRIKQQTGYVSDMAKTQTMDQLIWNVQSLLKSCRSLQEFESLNIETKLIQKQPQVDKPKLLEIKAHPKRKKENKLPLIRKKQNIQYVPYSPKYLQIFNNAMIGHETIRKRSKQEPHKPRTKKYKNFSVNGRKLFNSAEGLVGWSNKQLN